MAPTIDAYWLGLRRVHGVGPRVARLLLERFGSADRIFAASEADLTETGIPRPTARNIRGFQDFAPIERELCELPRVGARLIKWNDPEYPANLRHIADPPPYFFQRGSLTLTDAKYVAVVGARAASEAGRRMAQRMGMELAAKGFTVVSGLARGIDSRLTREPSTATAEPLRFWDAAWISSTRPKIVSWPMRCSKAALP